MEKEDDLIQVLWVEDDPIVTKTYPGKAETFGLQLVPFPCWDDAKTELDNDYDRWSAIILDAKCKQHRESADNAIKFLGEALKDIATISKEKGRIIPWYVLTGGAESEVSDSITDDRLKWDADWTKAYNKNYYSKNVDNEMLFRRIRHYASISPRIQIQEMYREYYEQLSGLNSDVCSDIMSILEAMHFPKDYPNFNSRHFFNPLRKALEYIFRAMKTVDLIPNVFFNRGNVNLNQCFMFVCGMDAEKMGYRHGDGGFAPRHIQYMMSLILNLGNAYSHSSATLTDKEIQNYEKHILEIGGNTKLMIFSMALQYCEILRWANTYIKEHQDKEVNREKWVLLENNDNQLGENIDDIGIVERDKEGVYHVGSYLLSEKFIEIRGWLGQKVIIKEKENNTNPITRERYQYFAKKIQLFRE